MRSLGGEVVVVGEAPPLIPTILTGSDTAPPAHREDSRAQTRTARLIQQFAGQNVGAILARGAAASFFVGCSGTLISFLAQILLARSIDADQYGEYAYVLSIMNMALIFGKFEFDPCSVRFVGAYHGTDNFPMLRGYLRRSHQIVIGASLLVSAAGAIVVCTRWHAMLPSLAHTAVVGLLLQPVMALLALQLGCLQGMRRVFQAQGPSVVLRPVLFALLVLTTVRFAGIHIGAPGALLLQLIAASSALALSAVLLLRALPKPAAAAPPRFETRLWMRTAVGFMFIASANVVLGTQMDVFVVGTFLRHREAGIYGAASQLASLINFGVTAIIFVAVPMIAEMHAKKEPANLQRLVSLSTRWALMVATPATALLLISGPFILRWYGAPFVRGYAPLAVLSLGALLNLPIGSLAGFLLTMTGHERQAGVIMTATAVLNLLLTVILTPTMGMAGTALATVAAATVRAGVCTMYIRKHLALSMSPFRLARSS